MKILHVIPSVSPVRGGPSQAVLELVAAQRNLGMDSQIATTNDDGPGVLEVPLKKLSEYRGVPVHFFPRWSPRTRALREFAFSASLTRWLWDHVADYDLVHVHALFSYASTAAMFICRWKGRPYLDSPHGLLCTWSLQQSASRKRAYLAVVERANLNGSRGLEFATELEREEASPLALRAPSFVVPFGLHLPAFMPDARRLLRQKYELSEARPIILFLSRLHPKKGLDLLLDALETMADVDFAFVVAGSGEPEYESALRDRIQQGPLAGRVFMTGFAAGVDKDLLLQGADVFALTSHSESLAIVVLEALAAGLPVVLTPGVPLSPMVQEHGLGVVTKMDAAEIAAALRSLLNIPRTDVSAARAHEFVRANFTWDVIARNSSQVYTSVLRDLRFRTS